ncbi:iron uptake porin (plasmid) [Kovacikia minuta CCNUW1]|uniref:iron uptake porin n=1 Tax=Kovacikia minuta TaxID=2931930 RepID=UPI001CCF7402|nr:iron uptake porin [Kovacikia minuta]UBF30019.1 iron uptake porin [Kovacikia minuta CCNUW1]
MTTASGFAIKAVGRSLGVLGLTSGGWLGVNSAWAVEELTSTSAAVIFADTDPTHLMEQVTSVSQLTDVDSTHWSFQALQSLVERYGCIVGYPDKSYRGNRALSRYEFAAGVNACFDRISELLAAATADLVKKEDLLVLQKLQEEFAAELATLRGRVDTLETRTATLEKQPFSTTVKLSGEVLAYLGDGFGEVASDFNETTFNYRMRLNFDASFSGRDRLRIRLQAANMQLFNAGNPDINNSTGGFGAPQRFANAFPNAFSDETRILPSPGSQGANNSSVGINTLDYRFPIGEKLTVFIAAGATDPTGLGADPVVPFSDWATTSLSNFSNSNPIYYPNGNRAGAGFAYRLASWLELAGGYAGQNVNGTGGPNIPGSSSGIFNGGYSAFGQATFYLGSLTLGLAYLNTYAPQFGIDTFAGSNAAKVSTGGTFGIAEDDRVSSNKYGASLNYTFSQKLQLGGWIGYSKARVLGVSTSGGSTGRSGDVDVLNYAAMLAFPDLLRKGNLGGIVFGMQPKVIDTSNARVATAIGLPEGRREDRDTGFHIEAFYTYRVNDQIAITPGFFWLTAPNHDSRNPDAFVGVIRTSFLF